MLNLDTISSIQSNQWFKVCMPYTFKKMEHPTRKYCYLPLNRSYKPLGYSLKEEVDYSKYLESHAIYFSQDPSKFHKVWSEQKLFLYKDNPESLSGYSERLMVLLSKIKQ